MKHTRSISPLMWGITVALVAVLAAMGFAPHLAAAAGLAGVMGVTTDTVAIDNLMKIIYSDPLVTDIVQDSELMDLFKTDMNVQSEETTGGKWVEMAHYVRLAGAAGARAENDYIPQSETARALNSRIYLRKQVAVVEMTGDVMDKVVGDEGAFINYMERALPDTKQRLTNDLDRQYLGFGAGIRARVAAVDAVNHTITLKDTLGIAGLDDPWLQFQEGERIVFSATAAGTAFRNAGTAQSALIESIDPAAGKLYLTIDAGTEAAIVVSDYIFGGDGTGASAQLAGVDRELAGLYAAVDDGGVLATYNNVDRTVAANAAFKATVFDASVAPYSGAVSEQLLIVADAKMQVAAGAKFDTLVASPHGPISYWLSMKGDRVLNDPLNYTGGKGDLKIALGTRVIPIRSARKLPAEIAFALTSTSFRRFTLNQWQWVSRGGSIWNQVVDAVGRKDAWFAFGKMYEQLACIAPRQNIRFEGLARQFTY